MNDRERNARLLAQGFEAFNRGDLAGMTEVLDPRIEAHVDPQLANPGTWHGIEGFALMLAEWNEAFASQVNTIVGIEFPDEHHVIAEVHQEATGAVSGAPVEMTIYYLFEVRDGLTVRLHLYADETSAIAAVR